jgi:transcriptional regulator with XRE-family HTH domain
MPRRTREQPPLARRVTFLRQLHHVTQEELAKCSGLSQAAVQAIEQGARPDPRLSTLLKLAGALGVTLDELVRAA